MSQKLNQIWNALPAEFQKAGADPVEMAIAYIEYQKSVIGRLTHAFTGASDAIIQSGKKTPADEVSQTVKDLWDKKEEIERKLMLLERERKELDAVLAGLQKNSVESKRRIDQLRQFATSVRSLTGSTVHVSALVEIADDVLNKTA